ncbi:MAG: alpha-xylosidase, partial [Anaerolineae bacterium]|nr:alpha-xylosidase [Anaerolineae bacterium]
GSGSYRVPWLFDDEAVDVLRHFTQLKCRLMPYLYGAAVQAHQFGLPTMRAMMLEFPDDPGCDTLDRQYMLGDSLLVAPVFRADNVVDYYLPAGRWTHFLTGETVEGGGWRRDSYDFFSLPLWVRPNSIIPVGSTDTRPDYDLADNVTFHIFDLAEGASASATAPTIQGEADITLHIRRDGNTLHIQADNATKPWRVLLRGVSSVATVSGGSRNTHEQGTLVVPETGVSQLTVELL